MYNIVGRVYIYNIMLYHMACIYTTVCIYTRTTIIILLLFIYRSLADWKLMRTWSDIDFLRTSVLCTYRFEKFHKYYWERFVYLHVNIYTSTLYNYVSKPSTIVRITKLPSVNRKSLSSHSIRTRCHDDPAVKIPMHR